MTDATAIPSPATGSGSDTLVLGIAEDAYLGDAQFTVSVDGKQLGGMFTATALHAAGASQAFTFKGDFGSGQHALAVNFLNDAWGGTPATDRNLYVNAITYNGTNTSQSTTLMNQGPMTFALSGGTTPAVSETSDHGYASAEPRADRHLHGRRRHLRAQRRQCGHRHARHRGQPDQVRRRQLGFADRWHRVRQLSPPTLATNTFVAGRAAST